MKVVVLADLVGNRLPHELSARPKAMVEVGGKPMIWHILSIFARHGITESVVCCGESGGMIKDYFVNYGKRHAEVTVDPGTGEMEVHKRAALPWKVTLVDTGVDTMSGGRLGRVLEYLDPDEPFCCTYGDEVADIDITELLAFHHAQNAWVTLSAARPRGGAGWTALAASAGAAAGASERVSHARAKSDGDRVNVGFFVIRPDAVRTYVRGDSTGWEQESLRELDRDGRLSVYKHDGIWYPMNTPQDKQALEALCASGSASWQVGPPAAGTIRAAG